MGQGKGRPGLRPEKLRPGRGQTGAGGKSESPSEGERARRDTGGGPPCEASPGRLGLSGSVRFRSALPGRGRSEAERARAAKSNAPARPIPTEQSGAEQKWRPITDEQKTALFERKKRTHLTAVGSTLERHFSSMLWLQGRLERHFSAILWLRSRLERHFSHILRLRGRLEQHFSSILRLWATLEQHFSSILRLRGKLERPFRAS